MTTDTQTAFGRKPSLFRRALARYAEYKSFQVSLHELGKLSDEALAEMGMDRAHLSEQVARSAAQNRADILAY